MAFAFAAFALAARSPQTTAVGTSYSFDGTSSYGPQRRRRLEEELCGVEQVPCEADYGSNYTIYGTALRKVLLDGYDKVMPPSSVRTGEHNYSQAGSVIYIQTRFFKVKEVNAAEGQMRLKVWFRTKWYDSRLSWNPQDYGNITTVPFLAESISRPENTEIWLPDLQPYNAVDGIINTLEPSVATVTSDGLVFWSRPGMFDVMCKFSGLVAFPYDSMRCDIELGGWAFSGAFQGVELYGDTPGYSFSDQEASSGSSYQEYTIRQVDCELKLYSYDDYPSESWPIVYYRVKLNRHEYYYVNFILIPSMVLALVSFFPFWMSWEVGERLSFGITLVLTMTTYQAIANSLLPVCGELLWIEIFSQYHFFATILALAESCLVLSFAYTKTENFLPAWMLELTDKVVEVYRRFTPEGREKLLKSGGPISVSILPKMAPPTSMVRRWSSGLVFAAGKRDMVQSAMPEEHRKASELSEQESVAAALYRRIQREINVGGSDASSPRSAAATPATATTPAVRCSSGVAVCSVSRATAGASSSPEASATATATAAHEPSATDAAPPTPAMVEIDVTEATASLPPPLAQSYLPTEESCESMRSSAPRGSRGSSLSQPSQGTPLSRTPEEDAATVVVEASVATPPQGSDTPNEGDHEFGEHARGAGRGSTAVAPQRKASAERKSTVINAMKWPRLGSVKLAQRSSPRFENALDGEGPRVIKLNRKFGAEDVRKLVFYERLYFKVDHDGKGFITFEEANRLLCFLAITSNHEQRIEAITRADTGLAGRLTRGEFCELCLDMLWDEQMATVEMAAESYAEAQTVMEKRHQIKWRAVSEKVDIASRFIIALGLYPIGLFFIFAVDMSDDYVGEEDTTTVNTSAPSPPPSPPLPPPPPSPPPPGFGAMFSGVFPGAPHWALSNRSEATNVRWLTYLIIYVVMFAVFFAAYRVFRYAGRVSAEARAHLAFGSCSDLNFGDDEASRGLESASMSGGANGGSCGSLFGLAGPSKSPKPLRRRSVVETAWARAPSFRQLPGLRGNSFSPKMSKSKEPQLSPGPGKVAQSAEVLGPDASSSVSKVRFQTNNV